MEQNFNTINLEYIETKKATTFSIIVAFILVLILVFIPMYEIITQFKPVSIFHWCCQPSLCNLH